MMQQSFPRMTCRKCAAVNPLVFFGPVDNLDGTASCVCFNCARKAGWLTCDGDLKEGVQV